jgi:hypothetical protein
MMTPGFEGEIYFQKFKIFNNPSKITHHHHHHITSQAPNQPDKCYKKKIVDFLLTLKNKQQTHRICRLKKKIKQQNIFLDISQQS